MRFQIRQKVFSFGDNFIIKDEYDEPHFQVEGKVFSLGDKLRLLDSSGRELFYIEQQLFKLFSEYNLYANGEVVAKCKRRFALLGVKFDITSSYGNFTIEGSPMSYNFRILKNNRVIATADKRFFSFSDTYGVDIDDSEDYGFILSLVIIIDQVVHDSNKNHNH